MAKNLVQTRSIDFANDFFDLLLELDPPEGYSTFSLEQFAEVAPDNAAIYETFLNSVDPEAKFVDRDACIACNIGEFSTSFYGPSLYQATELDDETDNLVLRVANSFVPVAIEGEKLYAELLVGKLQSTKVKATDEDGKEYEYDKPLVVFSITGNREYLFVIAVRAEKGVSYSQINFALEDGEPIYPLLQQPKTGGSSVNWAPLITMLYEPGQDAKAFKPALEIPVIGVLVKDVKNPKPNTSGKFGVITLDPNYVPRKQFSSDNGEPVEPTYAFFTPGNLTGNLIQNPENYQARVENSQLVLKVRSYKKNPNGSFSIQSQFVTKDHVSLPAPASYEALTAAAAVNEDDMKTIDVPALAAAE